jgi:hypothetical protein
MMVAQQQSYDTELVKALERALKQARSLGYDAEKMRVSLSVADDVCTTYFEVVPPPGQVILGGDLTVQIDLNTQNVIHFELGQ